MLAYSKNIDTFIKDQITKLPKKEKRKDKSDGDNQLQIGEQASLETIFRQNSLFDGDRQTVP